MYCVLKLWLALFPLGYDNNEMLNKDISGWQGLETVAL